MFKSISDFFKNVFFPKFKALVSAVFTKSVQIAVEEIMDVARDIVKELSYETLSSSKKREEAYKRVVESLKANGKEFSESVVRTTIEMAYLELKHSLEYTKE